MNETKNFIEELDLLIKKYSVDKVILTNFDDDEMGYCQLIKIKKFDDIKFLVMAFSGENKSLSPCSAKTEANE